MRNPWTRHLSLLVLVPAAVLAASSSTVWAAVTLKAWQAGETLTAADLNSNFDAIKTELAAPSSWFKCGTLKDLTVGAKKCELDAHPVADYEYGVVHNSVEPHVIDCLQWNVGQRIANRQPYLVDSDDPTAGAMQLGGFVMYTGTNATDDDTPAACPADRWRHHYWKLVGGSVTVMFSLGCVEAEVFCRARR